MDKLLRYFLVKVSSILRINLLSTAYEAVGIGLSHELEESGESRFIERELYRFINTEEPIVFDVGANAGIFVEAILKRFPKAWVHAFEPNPDAFSILEGKFKSNPRVTLNNYGLSNQINTGKLYRAKFNKTTPLASQYVEVFDLHGETDVEVCEVHFTTLDEYVKNNNIHTIDFLKIDTEGNESKVLEGSFLMLKEKKIKVVQFEFNEMNIVSRVFLRDFYKLLERYSFFRLKKDTMFPLGKYTSKNEIFIIQNIIAVCE